MTPPTRVSYAQPTSNWNTSTTPKVTTTFNVLAGDLIVCMASVEHAGGTLGSTNPSISGGTGGTTTWTHQGGTPAATSTIRPHARIWTGAVTADGTGIAVSIVRPTGDNLNWGGSVTVWRDHGGVGSIFIGDNGAAGSSAPSVGMSCSDNSAVQCQINDWQAIDGTTRTWRTINGAAESESVYFRDSAIMAVYGGYSLDTGSAGTITQGLTTPSTMRWALVGVEILGTSGAPTPGAPLLRQDALGGVLLQSGEHLLV